MTFQPNDIVEVIGCGCVGIVTRVEQNTCYFLLMALGQNAAQILRRPTTGKKMLLGPQSCVYSPMPKLPLDMSSGQAQNPRK